ncbi:MAG: InlB B-repeat-containing protein [Acutalibacteraceae bacterium]|nr:InlB B-repeat-containing protein [Acutalibacteraceae bacterium]
MKTMKRLVAIALSVLMIFSSFSMIANAWDARNADGITLSITTKIFRLVDGKWTETEKVKQGEEVRARVYLNTDYYTNTGNLLFFYNNDFYEDSFGSGQNDLIVNPYYKALPYGITGDYVGNDSTSDVENFMIANGKITPDFANKHNFVYISYHFASGANNQKFNGSQWLFEFPLTVKADAADGTGIGDFFALEETTRSTSFKKGRMNVPKGPYDGTNETITSMANWDAVLYYSSQPVTLFDNFVTASFDAGLGAFADKSTEFYAEGDAGDALTVPTPTRSNYKFMGWKLKGADDSTAAEITEFPAVAGEYEAVWKSTTETGEELTFITKIYRLDPETNEWIYTDRVKPGEKVKARLFVDTSYFTNAGNIIMFYDSEFFTDSYVYNEKNDLVPNDSATSSAAVNRVSGEFAKIDGTNYSLQDLVTYGYITQDFADTHTAITARYQFNPSTSKKISGDEWFIEFDLEVLDTASGKGEFFIVENTIKNSGDGVYAYINIPLGEEGGSKEETSSMHLWDVIATVESYPVYIDSKITLDANGGNFGAAGKTSYVIEGTIGETVDYTAVPEAVRDGYTFAGWVDASVENPTEADIVDLPAEMPYNDAAYKAFWINNVEITFVIGDTEIKRIVTAGAPFEVPEDPTLEGCFFIDWSTDESGATLSGLPEKYPTEDEVYYAIFEADTYSVTYINEGAVCDGPTAVKYGDSVPVPAAPDKAGYKFDGWFDKDGKQPADYTSMPDNALEFTAKWTANSNVSYVLEVYEMDTEGAYPDAATSTVTYTDGVVDTTKTAEYTVPEGFTLDTAESVLTGTVPATGTLVLKAYLVRNIYKLNVVVNGETATEEYYYNEAVAPVADPVIDGFVFKGWVDADNNKVKVPSIMPANDVTVYADFEEDAFEAKFDAGDGKFESTDSSIYTTDITFGQDIVPPTEKPVKEGYEFGGWATPADPETPVTDFGKMDSDGADYIAIWNKTEFDVTFYDYKPAENGPISPDVMYVYATQTKNMGDTVAVAGNPGTFEHFTFLGWSTVEGDADSIVTEITMPAHDLALYAIYAPVKVMLIPKNDTCTTVIDRAGGDVDDYDAATSKWYVYGIKEYIKAPELLEEYIDVSGDGRIELIHVEDGLGGTWEYTGTGTVVNVYNRMGTPDNTSDDILVESFHIVIFGDINGDSVAQAIDATYVYDEAAGLTSWANPGSSKYAHYLAKAANVDGNTYVDAIDATYIGDHSIGIVKIDQVTGKLK